MNIKNLFTPLLIAGLSLAFVAVLFGVFLTRGKSKFWISKKMLIGSILLSLTAFLNQSCDPIGPTCYDPLPPNQIDLDNSDYSNIINVNINTDSKLTGILHDRIGESFSFNITDTSNTDTVQVGNIIPADGTFDESTEDVYIELDKDLPVDDYFLNLYAEKQSEQSYPISIYRLQVRNED